jgi:hypothetical protein
MSLLQAWMTTAVGCALAVQGILRVLYPRLGGYTTRKLCHMGTTQIHPCTIPIHPDGRDMALEPSEFGVAKRRTADACLLLSNSFWTPKALETGT